MEPDIVIVGQGICGSLLSWKLLQRGLSVKVYDTGIEPSATYAASGIINPITGKRFVKTWLADTLLPAAEKTYAELSGLLSIPIYDKLPIYKLPTTIKEQNDWAARATDDGYSQYLSRGFELLDKNKIHNPLGASVIEGGGRLHTIQFLKAYRAYLKSKNILIQEPYTSQQAIHSSSKVFFCNGYQAAHEGLFSNLSWQLAKGEYLLVHIKDFYHDRIISADTTISPTGAQDIYYAGATYQWDYTDLLPSIARRQELINGLQKMLVSSYEIVAHGAAIRPTVKDRRPFIFFHPTHQHIGIFNGMGTKGISLAPYFAQHLANHIVDGTEISFT